MMVVKMSVFMSKFKFCNFIRKDLNNNFEAHSHFNREFHMNRLDHLTGSGCWNEFMLGLLMLIGTCQKRISRIPKSLRRG